MRPGRREFLSTLMMRAACAGLGLEVARSTRAATGDAASTRRARVVARGLVAPESPKPQSDGSVLVVEMARGTLSRVLPGGEVRVVAQLGGCPTGVAVGPDGSAFVMNNSAAQFERQGDLTVWVGEAKMPAMAPCIQVVDLKTGAQRVLLAAGAELPLVVPNDLIFDREGGFYFTDTGAPGGAEPGGVFWALADGSVVRRLADVPFANGIVLAPDQRRLLVASIKTIVAFDVTGPGRLAVDANGVARGRTFAAIPDGRFDSMAEEASGGLVVGTILPGQLTVFDPDGRLRDTVPLPPEKAVTSVGFGGRGRRTAYVTCTQTGMLLALDWPRPGLRPNFD